MSEETPGVVFDCNLFLQAALSSLGPAFACLNLVDQGSIRLLVSPEVLSEARDVLNRPKLTQKFATLAPERVGQFLANIEAKAVLVNDVPRAVELPHDPKDEPYIADRQRIARLFPTAHRAGGVASDRQRIASFRGGGECGARHLGSPAFALPRLRASARRCGRPHGNAGQSPGETPAPRDDHGRG